MFGDTAIHRQPHFYGEFHRFAIERRQNAGHAEANGTDLRILRRAEGGAATTKDFGIRQQLRVDFEADDGFEIHNFLKMFFAQMQVIGWKYDQNQRRWAVPKNGGSSM
jgi:hypothetical protein